MRRSEFERCYGHEAASVAEIAGAKFESEMELVCYPETRAILVKIPEDSTLPNHTSRSLTRAENRAVAVWWNARAGIKALFGRFDTAPDGSPVGNLDRAVEAIGALDRALEAALAASEVAP